MLSLTDVKSYIPENRYTVTEIAVKAGLTAAQAHIYYKFYGLEFIAVADKMHTCQLLTNVVGTLLAKTATNHFDTKQIKYLIYCHTAQVMVPFGDAMLDRIKNRFGLSEAIAFGVSMNKCVSTLSCFEIAEKLLDQKNMSVLIITGEVAFTPALRIVPNTSVVGDAAAAILVNRDGQRNKLMANVSHTYGRFSPGVWLTPEYIAEFEASYLTMLQKVVAAALAQANICINDIKIILPHNVNYPSWYKMAKILNVPLNLIFLDNIKKYGHCFGADVLINLESILAKDLLKPGDYFMMVTVGLGAVFAATIFRH